MTAVADRVLPNPVLARDPSTVISQERIDSLLRHLCVEANPVTAPLITPLTGRQVTEIPLSSEAAVDTAFAIARQAQKHWAMQSPQARARVILRFHDLVLERREEGLDIIQLENGKARIHAAEELLDVAMTSRHYARTAPALLKPVRQQPAVPVISSVTELHHPKGVIGVISPWNYPLTLAVSDAIPALLAGNGIVLKPDLQTTLCALWAVDLLYEAGIPDGLFGVVAGEGPKVGPMITERGDYIMFTGSTNVGRQVAARCGQRLVGCSMELGGKNAMVVCDDVNLRRGAEIAQRACFANSGQLCISMERMYIHSSIFDEFSALLVERVKKMRLSAEIGWNGDMGSLITRKQLDTITRHVDDAVAKGARILVGGKPRPDIGPFFFEPTILTDVTAEMECYANETFGPVVSLYKFDTEAEAIALANDSPYGLNASVLVGDTSRGRLIAAQIHAGTVNVNEGYAGAWGATSAPMGGYGDSGLGRRHGSEGLLKYTETQTVATQRFVGLGTPPILTHKQWADTLALTMKFFKAIGRS